LFAWHRHPGSDNKRSLGPCHSIVFLWRAVQELQKTLVISMVNRVANPSSPKRQFLPESIILSIVYSSSNYENRFDGIMVTIPPIMVIDTNYGGRLAASLVSLILPLLQSTTAAFQVAHPIFGIGEDIIQLDGDDAHTLK
jgi:hypothetical protein